MSETNPTNIELGEVNTELEMIRMAFITMSQEATDVMLAIEESTVPRQVRVPVYRKNDKGKETLHIMTKRFVPKNKLTGEEIDTEMRNKIYANAFKNGKEIIKQYKKMKEANPELGLINGTEIMPKANIEKKILVPPPTVDY